MTVSESYLITRYYNPNVITTNNAIISGDNVGVVMSVLLLCCQTRAGSS